jgi:hypothetical protein
MALHEETIHIDVYDNGHVHVFGRFPSFYKEKEKCTTSPVKLRL